jgi:hypothetical protein
MSTRVRAGCRAPGPLPGGRQLSCAVRAWCSLAARRARHSDAGGEGVGENGDGVEWPGWRSVRAQAGGTVCTHQRRLPCSQLPRQKSSAGSVSRLCGEPVASGASQKPWRHAGWLSTSRAPASMSQLFLMASPCRRAAADPGDDRPRHAHRGAARQRRLVGTGRGGAAAGAAAGRSERGLSGECPGCFLYCLNSVSANA